MDVIDPEQVQLELLSKEVILELTSTPKRDLLRSGLVTPTARPCCCLLFTFLNSLDW